MEDIERSLVSKEEKSFHIAKKLFSQWLDLDDGSEDFEPIQDLGFEFAYYSEGVPSEDNSSEEYCWYLVFCDYHKSLELFVEIVKKLSDRIESSLSQPNVKVEKILGDLSDSSKLQMGEKAKINVMDEIIKFARKVEKDPMLYKLKLVVASVSGDNREAFFQFKKESFLKYYSLEFISIETVYNRISDENTRSAVFQIKAPLNKFGNNLLLGSIHLKNLYHFLEEYASRMGDIDLVYQKNVRKYLGSRNKVNKEIRKTILESPESFGLYNNGITMVVGAFESAKMEKMENEFEVMEPFIVNGCQTSKTIWETLSLKFREKSPDPDWLQKLDHSTVVLKIVDIGSGTNSQNLLKDITKFTNSQSVVKTSDFISLEDDFNKFHEVMANEFGVYLEIQRGGWESQLLRQKNNPEAKPSFTEYSNAFDLIKVYAAGWLEEVGKASGSNPPFAPGGSIFKKITDPENPNKIDARDMYACHLLQKEANQIGFGRTADKAWKARTKYLFYFSLIKILCDILIKQGVEPEKDKKIITKSVISIFENHADLKRELIENVLELIEEYMTQGKDECIFTEPDFSKYKEIKDFFKLEKVGKTEIYKNLLQIQIRTMKRSNKGFILYNALLEAIRDLR